MSRTVHPRPGAARRGRRALLLLLIAVLAVVGAVAGFRVLAAPSSSSAPDGLSRHVGFLDGVFSDGVGVDDGVVPDAGVSAFDDGVPAVVELDPGLRDALRRAATAAAAEGVEFSVTSGWRSPDYQDQLLEEAISRYGSAEEAARWVATSETSAHVSGDAVDVGPADARTWLAENGAAFGLCQIYDNEPWHYELRPQAAAGGCPALFHDPTHDPRMQP